MRKRDLLKRYKLLWLTIIAICLFLAIYFEKGSQPELAKNGATAQSVVPSHKKIVPQKSSEKVVESEYEVDDGTVQNTEIEVQYSFRSEVSKVMDLVQKLPQAKNQLLNLITQQDVFQARQIEVKPHSINEEMQMKMGAVKVLALRELMKSPIDNKTLKQDLDYVIRQSQDPTIRRIAQAAKDSLNDGRSFFDDFVDGVDRMSF